METMITISIEEYKELLETKIRKEYEEKIREIEKDRDEWISVSRYWNERYDSLKKEMEGKANAE